MLSQLIGELTFGYEGFPFIIALHAGHGMCLAQFWSSDLNLPRLKGVKKIVIKTTRYDDRSSEPNGQVSKTVLLLNKEGLVAREDDYDQGQSWLSGYITYAYIGRDTIASIIKVFSYPGQLQRHQKPPRTEHFVQKVEFADDHADPRHHKRRVYRWDDSGRRYLQNITAGDFDAQGRAICSRYTTFGSGEVDSTNSLYQGDTLITLKFHRIGEGVTQAPVPDVIVSRKDSCNRLIHVARIASNDSDMLLSEDLFYDNRGRYVGRQWERPCSTCKSGWLKGREQRRYDSRSRLVSLETYTENKRVAMYQLAYFD